MELLLTIRKFFLDNYKRSFSISIIILATILSIIFFKNYFEKNMLVKSKADTLIYSSTVNINFDNPKAISKNIFGVNFYLSRGNVNQLNNAKNQFNLSKLGNMGVEAIRLGGCASDVQDPKPQPIPSPSGQPVTKLSSLVNSVPVVSYGLSIDEVITFGANISPSLNIFYGANVETKGLIDPCGLIPLYPGGSEQYNKTQLLNDIAAVIAPRTNNIRYIELGNEQWGSWWPPNASPVAYVSTAKEFATRIRTIDPNIKIGLVGYPTSGNNMDPNSTIGNDIEWTNAVVSHKNDSCGDDTSNYPCFDYITDHAYFYHGYSDPNLWPFPSPVPSVPDYTSNVPIPKYQFGAYSFLDAAGTKLYVKVCPVSYAMGSAGGYACKDFDVYDLVNMRGAGGESYRGVATYRFYRNGEQRIGRAFIDSNGSNYHYQECSVNANVWTGLTCPADPLTDWSTHPINVGGGNGPYYDYDVLIYIDNDNRQNIRERYTNNSSIFYERNCSFNNANYGADCPQSWTSQSINDSAGNPISVKSISSSVYFGLNPAGTGSKKQFVTERYLASDGVTQYFRDCYVNDSDVIDCSNANITKFGRIDLSNLRGTGNESYSAFGDVIWNLDNSNDTQFSYNFPGIAAYYAASEAGNQMDRRLADYNPKKLAVTEWNFKCWGEHSSQKNPSGGTVDHGFFIGETLLKMAQKGIDSANLHDLTELYNEPPSPGGCSLFRSQNSSSAVFNPQGEVFSLISVIRGGQILTSSNVGAPTISLPANPACFGSGCLNGGSNVSKLSSYAALSSDNNKLYVFLINRNISEVGNIVLNIANTNPPYNFNQYKKKLLNGINFTNIDFAIDEYNGETFTGYANNSTVFSLPPVSILRVEFINITSANPTVTATVPTPTRTPTPTQALSPSPIPSVTNPPQSTPTPTIPISISPKSNVILNSATSQSCSQLCSANKLSCVDIGTDLLGSNNLVFNSTGSSCYASRNKSCSTVVLNTGKQCAGKPAMWTYCRCQ